MRMWTSIEKIRSLLDAEGLVTTWQRVLRTHVVGFGNNFSYILSLEPFKRQASLHEDVIDGLSIGEISVLYEFSLAYADRKNRKDLGQYFTPDDVAIFMARRAKEIDPKGEGVWVDPCSGVGNLAFRLVEQQISREEFLKKNLYLIDIDPLALLIARVLFTLAFQEKDKRLYRSIEDRFICVNFLSGTELPKFDYAILNPPYVVVEPDKNFETAGARDLYAYFLERVAKLAERGFVSVTPQSFTNGNKFVLLRELFLREPREISVYCFDNVPDSLFKGYKFGSENTNTANSTRAAITVARRAKRNDHRITPLLRWRSKQRGEMLARAPLFLTKTIFSPTVYPKISRELEGLYREVQYFPPLENLVSRMKTPHILHVPSTPRYFISALKTPVSRTSTRTLYFRSEADLNRAYLLLNSSYMYWWWRINDGGMTISEKTLLSLPIKDDFAVDPQFVRLLEESERTNKVYKLNAGKRIENIKHDPGLVRTINRFLFPDHADFMGSIHHNSVLEPQNSNMSAYAQ